LFQRIQLSLIIKPFIMKRIILSMSLLLTLGVASAFAGPGTDPVLEKIFKKEFKGAEHVKWSREKGYDKATFVLGGHRTIAWFGANGELLGSVRDIFYNQLPLVVMSAVDKRFSDAAMLDIWEVTTSVGTRYKLTLEHKARKYNVSVYTDGSIGEIEKLKK
jgi:hypothetical protein